MARHPKARFFVRQGLFADVTSFTELETRIASLADEQSRGDAFEVFAEAYLATQRKHDAAKVWPLTSVPTQILQTLGLASKDYGVDGVFQTLLGNFNAYQVKFRTNRPALTWRELSTFMGLADSPHIRSRLLLTNCDDLPSVLNERQGFFCIRGSDLDRLEADDFRAIEAWLADTAFVPPRKQPQPHQVEALAALLPALETHDRVSAIMACGTGKTLVALWVAERRQASRILVLVPSLALLRQILHEWLGETSLPSLAYLCVCSDPTVKEGLDAIATPQSDLDFQVSTDAASVREFLNASFAGVKVIFSTYQSARVVGAALKPGEGFDLAVFDEAHKTAGREDRNYAFALEDSNLPIRKRLFLTATPRHYNPLRKDKEGDAQLVFSMDRPEVYGPQVFRLTFAEAARRKIICGYKVIISVITSEMVTNELLSHGEVMVNGDPVRARQVANQIALRDAIEKYGVKKVFTFHSTVKSAASFVADGSEGIATHLTGYGVPASAGPARLKAARENPEALALFKTPPPEGGTPNFQTFHVNGTMPTARREREMRDFKAATRAVMSNARCLTEGVDVPAVDMVAFLSPRRSRVDIVQATGRAMRRSPGKTTGYVLVPLYVEQAVDETVEAAVSRSAFDEVWDVLHSLQEQDDVLAELIRYMGEQTGRGKGFDDSRFADRVEIVGIQIGLEALRSAVTTRCFESLFSSWDTYFGKLVAFKERFGHCNVPHKWKEQPSLPAWVGTQRQFRKKGLLNDERIERLDGLGFVWDVIEAKWEEMFQQLQEFKVAHGHVVVPYQFEQNPKLANWVKLQRTGRKQGDLTSEREFRLNELGFVWDAREATWEEMFVKLSEYKAVHGDCEVPQRFKDRALSSWVDGLRQRFRQGKLAPSQVARLDSLRFCWEPHDKTWQEMYEILKEYRKQHGNCDVPRRFSENQRLSSWVGTQRQHRKRGMLSEERLRKLDEIGFISEPRNRTWDQMVSALGKYRETFGNCEVPPGWNGNPTLATWVQSQRAARKTGVLKLDCVARLDKLGFVWDTLDRAWEQNFVTLTAFKAEHGHTNVPSKYPSNPKLAIWVGTQRHFKTRGKLSADRRIRLESLGFIWNTRDAKWEEMFSKLLAYRSACGSCDVPDKWSGNPRLANWVSWQRQMRRAARSNKTGILSEERIRRLDEMGFVWRNTSVCSSD